MLEKALTVIVRMLINNEIIKITNKIKTCTPGSPRTPLIIIGLRLKVTSISNKLTIEIIKEILPIFIVNSI